MELRKASAERLEVKKMLGRSEMGLICVRCEIHRER